LSGTLRIGVIPTISPYLLPCVTPALREAYPRLTLIWLEDKTHTLVRGLRAGTLDAALLALEAEIGDVEREVIAKDPFVLVAPEGNSLVDKKAPVKAAELRDATVLLLDDEHVSANKPWIFVCASMRMTISSGRRAWRRLSAWSAAAQALRCSRKYRCRAKCGSIICACARLRIQRRRGPSAWSGVRSFRSRQRCGKLPERCARPTQSQKHEMFDELRRTEHETRMPVHSSSFQYAGIQADMDAFEGIRANLDSAIPAGIAQRSFSTKSIAAALRDI
jgi:hypothetical protein